MTTQLQFLLIAVAGWMNGHQQAVIEFLQEENRVLLEQLKISVLNPSRIGNRASCRLDPWPLEYSLMKTARAPLSSLRDFYTQLSHFDPMLREDLAKNLDDSAPIPASANLALSFAEKLMLCPTPEAARTCIRRDMAGAVSFVLALHGVFQRIEKRTFQLPTQSPEYQTPFYVLASAVQEYLDSLQTLSAEAVGNPLLPF